jgi:hypothetical protein
MNVHPVIVINLITQKIVNNEVTEPIILRGVYIYIYIYTHTYTHTHTQNMDTKLSLAQTMCI